MAGELMRVTVTHEGGSPPNTYTIKPATIVAFERQFAVGLGALATEKRMEWIYWLAWDAERRSGAVVKPFDGWLDEIVDVDLEDEPAPLGSAGATPEGSPA